MDKVETLTRAKELRQSDKLEEYGNRLVKEDILAMIQFSKSAFRRWPFGRKPRRSDAGHTVPT